MKTEVRALMWEDGGRWRGRLLDGEGTPVDAATREACVAGLRRAAGTALLTVEVQPALVGVAEAAELLGWDKRRIFTYLGRGVFPVPVAALASGRVLRRSDIEAFAGTRRTRTPKGGRA